MGKLLAIDIGNTRAKAGVFSGDRLLQRLSFDYRMPELLAPLFSRHKIDAAIVSSVVQEAALLEKFISAHAPLHVLNSSTKIPLRNRYKTPQTLGGDRLACAAGAASLFPHKNVLSIDAGTCIKYDLVDQLGNYRGGSISPGISMRLSSLHEQTGKLPLLSPGAVKHYIGKDTQSSIMTGVVLGVAGEMESFVRRYRKDFPGLKVLLTGGDASRLAKHLNFSIFATPDLVLIGLNSILRHAIATR